MSTNMVGKATCASAIFSTYFWPTNKTTKTRQQSNAQRVALEGSICKEVSRYGYGKVVTSTVAKHENASNNMTNHMPSVYLPNLNS